MGAQVNEERESSVDDEIQSTKTLICAVNLLSRNLPLPPHLFDAVSSIYNAAGSASAPLDDIENGSDISSEGNLMAELEDALSEQRPNYMSGAGLTKQKEERLQSNIQHRITELEELPASRGESIQSKCLLELYGLKLAELQKKVRSDVNTEFWLRKNCACPEKQLFDWGMMRLRRPPYGVGDAFAMEANNNMKKKRDAERLSRLEEEAKNRIENKKRKFFSEILDAARELQLQIQAAQKRRKQRNDGVQVRY